MPASMQAFEEAVKAIVHRKAPRWTVVVNHRPSIPDYPVSVDLEHPLSNGRGWTASLEEVEGLNLDFFVTMIDTDSDREFYDISEAPELSPNAALLRDLRLTAGDFNWSHEECQKIARILEGACGCIRADEAEWFANFTGHGAPRCHRQWP